MQELKDLLKSRLDRVTRPEPTIVIHRGEEFYLSDTGEQERATKTFVKFSVKFREQQLMQLKGAPLSVFICLALHIAEDGSCFPSVSLICKETGYNRDTVFDALKKWEFMGSRTLSIRRLLFPGGVGAHGLLLVSPRAGRDDPRTYLGRRGASTEQETRTTGRNR